MHPEGSMYGVFAMGRGGEGAMGRWGERAMERWSEGEMERWWMFDVRWRIKDHDAVMLYLNLLECYIIFVSFFSFRFSFLKKPSSLATNLKNRGRSQE